MSSPRNRNQKPPGQVRQSQVVTTFGPGSMFDLPNHSVIVGGLEYWTKGDEVQEPRLVAKLKESLKISSTAEAWPSTPPRPIATNPTSTQKTGISDLAIPGVVHHPGCHGGRVRAVDPLAPPDPPELAEPREVHRPRTGSPSPSSRSASSGPASKGHIGDIDWFYFVHRGDNACRRDLWIDERGTSGDLSEVWVRCECKAERPIIEATKPDIHALGRCDGWQPWLGPHVREGCDEQNRMLVRTASNAYFPQTMSVISLPDRDEAIARAVDQVWEHHLQYVEDLDDLVKERKRKPPVAAALEGLSDEDVFAEVQARKQGRTPGLDKKVKQAEFETLVSEQGGDRLRQARRRLLRPKPAEEVLGPALDGGGRAGRPRPPPPGGDRRWSGSPASSRHPRTPRANWRSGSSRAPLASDLSWLPAVENRGEGVFIQFRSEAIDAWVEKPAVKRRGCSLRRGSSAGRRDHDKSKRKFSGLPYILLHSLSHQLITAISLECGYPASSIRERIYAGPYGDGILLYTGSPDAEGTMGGLVEAGRQIARHMKAAIDLGRLCSNDPVCAQHAPENHHECRFLHGAACHGCLLIAETSCEQHNDFLDRALVISTVDGDGAEFFGLGRHMTSPLCLLTTEDLRQLAGALRSGRVSPAVLAARTPPVRPR